MTDELHGCPALTMLPLIEALLLSTCSCRMQWPSSWVTASWSLALAAEDGVDGTSPAAVAPAIAKLSVLCML